MRSSSEADAEYADEYLEQAHPDPFADREQPWRRGPRVESMEIRELAESVLFGSNLEEKLVFPRQLTDADPGLGIKSIATPSRPTELPFSIRADKKVPSRDALRAVDSRAELLHAFANHELLAMELMALALLKFPEAPKRFRRGLAAALLEEGSHLELYRGRVESYGSALGAFATSGFFWSIVSSVDTPQKFVAAMSLTLEQANLDFAAEYAQIFARLDDVETQRVLEKVLKDEIRHVRFGFRWFDRWRDQTQDIFESYARSLTFPLTPARAKGPRMAQEARKAAGLPDSFIEHVAVFGASRGRPPDVHFFNPDAEDEIAGRSQPTAAVRALVADLELSMAFLAKADDVVLLSRTPGVEFLVELTQAGFVLPELRSMEEASIGSLARRKLGEAKPWARTEGALRKVRSVLGDKILGDAIDPRLFSRELALEWSDSLTPATTPHRAIVRSSADLEVVAESIRTSADDHFVLKSSLSASGRHRVWFHGRPDDAAMVFAKRSEAHGTMVLERWLDKVADFGILLEVGAHEPVLAVRRFVTNKEGSYRGHILSDPLSSFDPETRAALGKAEFIQALRTAGRHVAQNLLERGFRGPAGVDAILFRQSDRFEWVPILEINPRRTMGHVALAFESRIHPKSPARWVHVLAGEVRRMGHSDLSSWAKSIRTQHPIQTDDKGRMLHGILPTADPNLAQRVLPVLCIGSAVTAFSDWIP